MQQTEKRQRTYRELLGNLIALLRVREWIEKIQVNFLAALILLIFLPLNQRFFYSLIVFGVYQSFLICYGYVINSYTDKEQDARAKKHPEVAYFSDLQLLTILSFLVLGALGIPLYLNDLKIKSIGLITFLLATFYSLKPIRFKERYILGLIIPALTQRPLLFLFFAFLIPCNEHLVFFLFGWLCFYGIIFIMTHQVFDYEKDKRAGVSTWALKVGKERAKKWTTFVCISMPIYTCLPVFIFPLYNGIAMSFILLAFTAQPIIYYKCYINRY
jgi:4-hydroxybenzoate polyprenyltransferase